MTYQEIDYFFKQDKKKYDLKSNVYFLKWYKNTILYQIFSIGELQYLVDFLSDWYKLKYPNQNPNEKIEDISKYLTHEQMLYRLNSKYYSFLDGYYRTGNWCAVQSDYSVDKQGNIIKNDKDNGMIGISILKKNENRNFNGTIFSSMDGIVNKKQIIAFKPFYFDENKMTKLDENFEPFIKSIFKQDNYLTLEEFYERAIKKQSDYDFKYVKRTIERHELDWKLRELIFAWTLEKMIFDEESIPEESIKRALHFVKDIKKEYWDTNITEQMVLEYYDKLLENIKKEKTLYLRK